MDVVTTFELRADLGICLDKLKDLSEVAIAAFPLLYHEDATHYGDVSQNIEDSGVYEAPRSVHSESDLLAFTDRMNQLIADWGLAECHAWVPLIDWKQVCLRSETFHINIIAVCVEKCCELHLYQ